MLVIKCPYCGPRDQSEFSYGGEAHVARPKKCDDMTDAEWAQYVFIRNNPKGLFAERWMHAAGCRRWFNAVRNTATDQFLAFYKAGEPMPHVDDPTLPKTPSGEPLIGSGNDATKVMREGEV